MNSLFTSQFNYCLLVWIIHSRILNNTINNKINNLHERCLRIDKTSSFEKLLETGTSVPIHIRNLQILATEFFKVIWFQPFTVNFFFFKKGSVQYNLRHTPEFSVPNVKSLFLGTESLPYLGRKIWDLVPKELKST